MVGRRDDRCGLSAEPVLVVDGRVCFFREATSSRIRFSNAMTQSYGSTVYCPCMGMEVVHGVSAPDNENSLLTQGRYAPADLVVKGRRLRLVDAKLHDRNVRCGIHVAQHRPRCCAGC